MNEQKQQLTALDLLNKVVQNRLNVYEAKEHFESILKQYNDSITAMCKVVNIQTEMIKKQTETIDSLHKKLEVKNDAKQGKSQKPGPKKEDTGK